MNALLTTTFCTSPFTDVEGEEGDGNVSHDVEPVTSSVPPKAQEPGATVAVPDKDVRCLIQGMYSLRDLPLDAF
jgi:hypothetical protein